MTTIRARVLVFLLMVSVISGPPKPTSVTLDSVAKAKATATRGPTPTLKATAVSSATPQITVAPKTTATAMVTATYIPTVIASETPAHAPVEYEPFLGAPLCAEHSTDVFHTLWDRVHGCHYDHEHGQNPFTAEVAGAFPGFDLQALLGGVQIGHTNPSSPAENTAKHGGFKWQVSTAAPQRCVVGFESGTVAVDAYAIQYHAFGAQSVEFEARQHSTAALLRQCQSGNPDDKGYVYVVQLQDYGQRVTPYQNTVLPYPDNFLPTWAAGLGPYFTTDCVGTGLPNCRTSLTQIRSMNLNANSIWTSKRTGSGTRPPTSLLFSLLFRVRDTYQVLDSADLEHPFTWPFVCGGEVYNPAGCRWNNTTTTIHEIAGVIPASWDNLIGWDTDPRVGRVSVEGFVDQLGSPTAVCEAPGVQCYPIRMMGAFVGRYSSELSAAKVSNPEPGNTPERDVYFCGLVPCAEIAPGAIPSGWVGSEN